MNFKLAPAGNLMTISRNGLIKHYFAETEHILANVFTGGHPLVPTDTMLNCINKIKGIDAKQISENFTKFATEYFVRNANYDGCVRNDIRLPAEMRNLPPLHKIYYNAGRSDKLYYFNANHLGSGSLITDGNGQTYQTLAYTPYGSQLVDIKHYSDIYNEPYRFGGKIKDEESGLNYFEARYYWDDGGFPISTDPHWYNYPHITSYNWCGQNPIMFIDPDGRDVWEVNDAGEIVNQIKDKTQDAFYMVAKDADGNYQRTKTTDTDGNEIDNGISFKYGTVTAVRTPTVNVQNSDGSITSNKLTTFEMKGDNNATQLFEFMANPGSTTNVEWSHAKVGTESSERNIVGTFHKRSSTAVGGYLRETGYTLREVNHNHPNGIGRPSGGDMRGAELYHKKNRNTILNIYTYPSKYFRYDQGGLIIP